MARSATFLALAALLIITPCLVLIQQARAQTGDTGKEIETAEQAKKALQEIVKAKDMIKYDSKEMRDPFISLLLGVKNEEGPIRPPGLAGMTIAELKLEGIWRSPLMGGNIAFILGSDKKSYRMQVGDKCYDGKVIQIDQECIAFEKPMFDPFGNPKPPKIIKKCIKPFKGGS